MTCSECSKLVSVIIPTYARPDNLCRAIDSVLSQTYPFIEIIVVDDNGEGCAQQLLTESILENYIANKQILYVVHKENKNGSAARNTGLNVSKGDYICFLDDDDVFDPQKIALQVDDLESRKEYGASYCNTVLYGKRRTLYKKNSCEGVLTFELLTGRAEFNTSTILFRRQSLLDIGGWDERFFRHQDWELMVRFFRMHSICLTSRNDYLLKKYETDNILNRNPECSIEFREFFLKEMSADIDKLSNAREVYRYQREMLSLVLMATGAKKAGRKQFFKIFKYGMPSFTAFGKFIYYMIK